MIVTCMEKLEVGRVYSQKELESPFETPEGVYREYTFLVIREATLEEYRAELNRTYPQTVARQIINYDYFYEIHSD